MGKGMRELFPGYYKPTRQEFDKLWQGCIFAFDASMLLHIYGYTPATQQRFLDVMTRLKDRIWLPHQAAFEYQKNRLKVISAEHKALETTIKILDSSYNELKRHLQAIQPHSFIEIEAVLVPLENTIKRISRVLKKKADEQPDHLAKDEIRDALTSLFEGRVGEPYSVDKLRTIYKEGEERYKLQVPPGFEDKNKDGDEKYGDLVLWYQLLDYAEAEKTPIILVIDDIKKDWKWEHGSLTIGPHPELRHEMNARASVAFYSYESNAFIEYAQAMLDLADEQAAQAIAEAKEAAEQDRKARAKPIVLPSYQLLRQLNAEIEKFAASSGLQHAIDSQRQLEATLRNFEEMNSGHQKTLDRMMSTGLVGAAFDTFGRYLLPDSEYSVTADDEEKNAELDDDKASEDPSN